MPNVPGPNRFNPYGGERGIDARTYQLSRSRLHAAGPFELAWKDKIYLRRIRKGETMTTVARALGVSDSTISAALKRAARRFDVDDYKELLALDVVQTILDGED